MYIIFLVCPNPEHALERKILELEERSLTSSFTANGADGEESSKSPGAGMSAGGSSSETSMHLVSEFLDGVDSDDEDLRVCISLADFEEAIRNTKLSLSAADYANYAE